MYERWLCDKYDVNYMIMQWQYDNNDACHDDEQNGGKLHGSISWNGYGNAIIGRYGGCFEEAIRRFMCDRAYSRDLDAPAKFAPTLKVRKGNARYRRG